ncbi:MAG: hypothetical protein RMK20_15850, partial [Verrucomicrobiales bacterium]|nr:hypothetical protein [Verrucomicrobiales bacterium]
MNRIVERHGARVFLRFLTDCLIFLTAFVIGMRLRFGAEWWGALELYYPSLLTGALAFSSAAYIFGLYAPAAATHSAFKRTAFVGLSLLIALGVMMGLFYVNFSARVGRGVMALGALTAFGMTALYHLVLLHQAKNFRERVAVVVGSEKDEAEARLVRAFAGRYLDFVGLIHYEEYRPTQNVGRVLGSVSQLLEIARREQLDRVVCSGRVLTDVAMCRPFCELRYSGVAVTPLIALFEEICQCVPVELITPEWLMSASGSPHMFYIRKIKRGFDIGASLLGLMVMWPFLLLGKAVEKLTSPGPV